MCNDRPAQSLKTTSIKYQEEVWDKELGHEGELIDPFNDHSGYMCVFNEIMGERDKDTEDVFYTKVAEQMIDNTLDTLHRTRRRSQPIGVVAGSLPTLDTDDGWVSSGIGVHLTPTKKRRIMKGQLTKYMQQDWYSDCIGDKSFKTMFVCSECRDIDVN